MANETISFACPACGIKLTVPATLAGVAGPCPSCRSQIQAPYPQAPAQVHPAAPPVYQTPPPAAAQPVYPAAPPQQLPVPQPAPMPQAAPAYVPETPVQAAPVHPTAAPAQAPMPPGPAPVSYDPLPPPSAIPVQVVAAPPGPPELPPSVPVIPVQEIMAQPVVLRPEPRQLPQRPAHSEPVARPMPEPHHGGPSRGSHSLPRHPHRRNFFIRLLLPLLFLIASGAVVFGVLTVLKSQKEDRPAKQDKPLPTPAPVLPETPAAPLEVEPPKAGEVPVLPVPAPEQPAISEPPPELPQGMEPETPSQSATEVREKVLAARTLAERLPLMETRATEAELAASCLAGPLPSASQPLIDVMENIPVEQVTDFYHIVDFDAGSNRRNPQTILVRTRGTGEPKVVVDPFLDLYGGRLAAYAKAPSDKAATFQVIVWPLASCYDDKVPNKEKKLTLKLLPQDNAKEIALAFFGRQSKIAQMLEDGTYSLSYGKAKACTVMLRWNSDEDPAKPYLEALDLKTLDWNP